MVNSNDPVQILVTIINALVIPILPVVTAYIVAFLKKKTAEIEESMKNLQETRYMNTAESSIQTAVAAVNQTYTDDLKKRNGYLTPYEGKFAFEMAREKALKIIGDQGTEAMQRTYSDFDIWLENRIEYYVNQFKKQPGGSKV